MHTNTRILDLRVSSVEVGICNTRRLRWVTQQQRPTHPTRTVHFSRLANSSMNLGPTTMSRNSPRSKKSYQQSHCYQNWLLHAYTTTIRTVSYKIAQHTFDRLETTVAAHATFCNARRNPASSRPCAYLVYEVQLSKNVHFRIVISHIVAEIALQSYVETKHFSPGVTWRDNVSEDSHNILDIWLRTLLDFFFKMRIRTSRKFQTSLSLSLSNSKVVRTSYNLKSWKTAHFSANYAVYICTRCLFKNQLFANTSIQTTRNWTV